MTYLQNKKLTFMSIVNRIKGFVRSVSGILPLILPDCVDDNSLISYSISGNSIQNGTPTPENPIEVESMGEYDKETGKYKIPVVCSGKNIVRDYVYHDQKIRYYNTITTVEPYTFKQGITYTISFDTPNTNKNVCFANYAHTEEGLKTVSLNGTRRFITFTPTKDLSITALMSVTSVVSEENRSGLCSNCMIEEGTTATDYEPYIEPVTTNIYLDEPLRKIGNYADYIDFENQKVVRKVYKKILTGTESWTSPTPAVYCISRGYVNPQYDYSVRTNVLCTHLQPSNLNNIQGCGVSSSNLIVNYDNGDMGRTAFKQLLIDMYSTGTPMIIYYVRAEAEEIPICLPKLPTFRGTTIYTVETSVQPSEMSATYYATSKE